MQILRLITAGSVDDGKSTLIGRLLYDSKLLLADQVQSLEKASRKRGFSYTEFALITDGLKDELEQGITIDIAYRYFTTGNRKYILADTPGHVQYTRNFVTAASSANIAILMIDARKGITNQTKRHALIASLMGVKHFVFCVNKMDLVEYQENIFDEIKSGLEEFCAKLEVYDIRFIPTAALLGDNVVSKSGNMPWYKGASVFETLETVHISGDRNLIDGRFPVQHIIRANTEEHTDYRACAGTIVSGIFKTGDEVTVLPLGINTYISAIYGPNGYLQQAGPPMSVSISLQDSIDVSRGNMIVKRNNKPEITKEFDALVCWLRNEEVNINNKFILRNTTQELKAVLTEIIYVIDINTLSRDETHKSLKMNEVARVRFKLNDYMVADSYRINRYTGSFVLIDDTNNTVAAGMVI